MFIKSIIHQPALKLDTKRSRIKLILCYLLYHYRSSCHNERKNFVCDTCPTYTYPFVSFTGDDLIQQNASNPFVTNTRPCHVCSRFYPRTIFFAFSQPINIHLRSHQSDRREHNRSGLTNCHICFLTLPDAKPRVFVTFPSPKHATYNLLDKLVNICSHGVSQEVAPYD